VAELKTALAKAERDAADAKKIAMEQSKLAIVQEEKALSTEQELVEVVGQAKIARCQAAECKNQAKCSVQACQVAKEAAVHYQAEAAKAVAQQRKRVAQAKRAARRAQEKLLSGCGLPADMLPEDVDHEYYDGEAKAPPAPCAPPACPAAPGSDVEIAKALLDRLTAAASPALPCAKARPLCAFPPPKLATCDTKTTKAAEKGDKKIEVASVAGINNGSQIIVGNEIRVVEDVDAEKREITLADELLADRGDGTSVKLMPAAPCEAAPPPPCPTPESLAAAKVAAAAAAVGITPAPSPTSGLQEAGEEKETPASLLASTVVADAKKGVLQASDLKWSSLAEIEVLGRRQVGRGPV